MPLSWGPGRDDRRPAAARQVHDRGHARGGGSARSPALRGGCEAGRVRDASGPDDRSRHRTALRPRGPSAATGRLALALGLAGFHADSLTRGECLRRPISVGCVARCCPTRRQLAAAQGALKEGLSVGADPANVGGSPGRRPRLRRTRANVVALAFRQPVDDQLVAVLDEPEYQLVGQRVVEGDGDPVTLVQVVAGPDG